MAYPSFAASVVLDQVAVLMNDAAKSIYPYTITLPYMNMALQELQEYFELNNIPVTDTVTSNPISMPAGTTTLSFTSSPGALPNDFVEPKVLWERQAGVNPYTPMTKLDFLPRYYEGTEINQFIYFTWQSQEIRVMAANQDNEIKIDYVRFLFAAITDPTTNINVINSQSYLEYRTAGLVAQFCAENPTRAQELNNDAGLSMDRVTGIGTKGRQAINIRHRPFRSSYKQRTYM